MVTKVLLNVTRSITIDAVDKRIDNWFIKDNWMAWRWCLWVLLAWSSIGLIHAMTRYADFIKYDPNAVFSWSETLAFMVNYALWAIITLILLRFLRAFQYPFASMSLVLLFVIGILVWLPVYFVLDYLISLSFSGNELADVFNNLVNTSGSVIFFYSVIYALTFAACSGVVLADKMRTSSQINSALMQEKTETALLISEQKMKLMQNQLSPHLLFNCLGSISALARHGEREQLIDAIAKVGNLLRFTIANAPEKLITLQDEITLVRDYIALQSLRFEDRFHYTFDIHGLDDDIMCPPFTLQPLLENAFRHGVEVTDETVSIEVLAKQSNEQVVFIVKNSIPDETKSSETTGTGLNNLRTRLSHLYKELYSFETTKINSIFIAELRFPIVRMEYEL